MADSTCPYEDRCLNKRNCFRCFNFSRLRLPEDAQREKNARKVRSRAGLPKEHWQQLEERVARDLNKVPTAREMEARRNPGSGNKWYRPGDVLDDVLLPEAKWRDIHTAKGEQQITITKRWLEKVAHEANGTGKFPCLVFQFAGDDQVYAVMNWDLLAALVQEYKFYRREWERQRTGQ